MSLSRSYRGRLAELLLAFWIWTRTMGGHDRQLRIADDEAGSGRVRWAVLVWTTKPRLAVHLSEMCAGVVSVWDRDVLVVIAHTWKMYVQSKYCWYYK